MTNKQPWQAIVNTTFPANLSQKSSTLSVVNKEFTKAKQKPSAQVIKFAAEKRYSFDDNGGGYKGL